MNDIDCRLCGAAARLSFTQEFLGKYPVGYFICSDCGSVETEPPYWLEEAYAVDVLAEDTEYLSRNVLTAQYTHFLLEFLQIPRSAAVLDFGGGLGLNARLLREQGRNAYCYDTYTTSPFADVRWPEDGTKPEVVTAFEVFEHLPNPAQDLVKIFEWQPAHVYVRTWRYSGQGPDWEYFAPDHGEHVFFYTDAAMEKIARRFGYSVILPSHVDAVFSREPIPPLQRRALTAALTEKHLQRRIFSRLSRVLTARPQSPS